MGFLKKVFKEINDVGHKWFGLSSPDHPNGSGADIYVGGTQSTDMGYNLEGKNTALTMGEMAPGEYTEMYGNNTAYNENNNNEKSTWDYIAPIVSGITSTAIEAYYNKELQKDQNKWNAEQAELNRQFNAAESEKARQYETNMANTAHQREMADLLATGLNPVNTATGGGGAATPGGSAASGTTAAGTNPAYMDHTALANTALSMAETAKAIKEMPYIAKEKKAQIANAEADTLLKGAQKSNTQESSNLIKEQAKQVKIDNITREDMNRVEIAYKENASEQAKQEAIKTAIENAYHTETGTAPSMTMVEKFVSVVQAEIESQIKNKQPINPIGAIKKAVSNINHR